MASFHLFRDDVEVLGLGSRLSGRRKVRQPRNLDLSSWKYTLKHRPTGVEVSGEVGKGHYSKEQFSRLKNDLLQRLWSQLERRVEAHLGIPGQ